MATYVLFTVHADDDTDDTDDDVDDTLIFYSIEWSGLKLIFWGGTRGVFMV
jgi:hypothetical protein